MAKTIANGVGMTNDWLASQGVLSLKTLWAELAHLRGTAAALLCVEPTRRTRMLGGVVRVPGNEHPYPISVAVHHSSSAKSSAISQLGNEILNVAIAELESHPPPTFIFFNRLRLLKSGAAPSVSLQCAWRAQ